MKDRHGSWENLRLLAGSAERVLSIGFRNDKLKPLTGKTLAQVAKQRGTPADETILDLIVEDDSRVDTAYFMVNEDNVALGLKQPWSRWVRTRNRRRRKAGAKPGRVVRGPGWTRWAKKGP